MKRFAMLVLLLLLAVPHALTAQETRKPPDSWNNFSPDDKLEILQADVKALRADAKENVVSEIKNRLAAFPFTGLGVSLDMQVKEENASSKKFTVRIVGVWRGSPAEQAGIRPGDWLVSVHGEPSCQLAPNPRSTARSTDDALKACLDSVTKMIREANGHEVVLQIEREGVLYVYHVGRQELGLDVRVFILWGSQTWERDLKIQARKLDALAEKVSKLKGTDEDSQKIDELYLEVLDIEAAIYKPLVSIRDEVDSRQILLKSE